MPPKLFHKVFGYSAAPRDRALADYEKFFLSQLNDDCRRCPRAVECAAETAVKLSAKLVPADSWAIRFRKVDAVTAFALRQEAVEVFNEQFGACEGRDWSFAMEEATGLEDFLQITDGEVQPGCNASAALEAHAE